MTTSIAAIIASTASIKILNSYSATYENFKENVSVTNLFCINLH